MWPQRRCPPGAGELGPRVRYKSLVTGARARGVIAALWVLAFGIGLTPFLGWNDRKIATNCTEPGDAAENVSCCLIRCLFENVVPMSYMVYFNFFGCVLPPLLIMLVIYVKIFLVACRQLQRTELMDHSRTVLQREIHAAKSLALIVGIFALCWLPVHTINCASLFQPTWAKVKPKWAINTAILLSHANSAVNPIVYAYRNRDFRYTFHKIISRRRLSNKRTGMLGQFSLERQQPSQASRLPLLGASLEVPGTSLTCDYYFLRLTNLFMVLWLLRVDDADGVNGL
ncbi:adenosine receptor A2b isoform X3 [Bubalus kerabau]|uniref:adenosine receptor A2b isoform X3 n=1 Tax=Bubalus carabanensis TaxID=3119969 RepID=UPI00244EDA59|nr:adenosine receptor A2b isoform X3 [Bubalus carabanensis]